MSLFIDCNNDYGSFHMIVFDEVKAVRKFRIGDIDDYYKLTLDELEKVELIRDPKLRLQLCISIEERKGYVIFRVDARNAALTHIKDLQYCHKRPARQVICDDLNSHPRFY